MIRINGLDTLRAVAILWVMIFHSSLYNPGLPFSEIFRFGWMGVDLFFVLSGYLIASQLFSAYIKTRSLDLGQFYFRRALRVLPAYWAVLALYFMVPWFRDAPHIEPLWQFLTFTMNLFIDFSNNRAFSHVWSLCIEEHFYLLFPFVVMLLLHRPSLKKTAIVCIAVVAGGVLLRGYYWLTELNDLHAIDPNAMAFKSRYLELVYFPTLCRLDGLLAGVCVAAVRCFRPTWWTVCRRRGNLFVVGGLVGLGISIWMFSGPAAFAGSVFVGNVFFLPVLSMSFALLVVAAASPNSVLGAWRIPGAGLTATFAYSLYLTHKEAFHLVKHFVPSWVAPGGFQALFVYAVATFAIGAALYWAVEKPFLWLRYRGSRMSSLRTPCAS